MNRITSSSNAQKKKLPQSQLQSQPQPPGKKERTIKRERFPVNPLKVLGYRGSGSSSCSNVSGFGSTSGESSNGCDRFLLSHSSSSSSSSSSSTFGVYPHGLKSVAPKSAPVVSKPLFRKKPRSLEKTKLKSTLTGKPKLQKSQRCKTNLTSEKKPTCKATLKKQSSVCRDIKLKDRQTMIRVDESIAHITPVTKLGTGSDLTYRSKDEARDDDRLNSNSGSYQQDRTPPVQASVSPEIQCGSSKNLCASSQSQACYAAGHLLSGVSDKRKCKPKGILTVEKSFEVVKGKIFNNSDEFIEGDFGNGGSCNEISVVPLPADASVHWLLSPCDEEKEHEKEESDDGLSRLQKIVECVDRETLSPLSDRSASSDLCNISSDRGLSLMDVCNVAKRSTSSSLSPNELSRFRRFIHLSSCDCEASALGITPTCELHPSENLEGDKPSPVSIATLGSENVIQTPESNSSFNNYFEPSYSRAAIHKEHSVGSELESLTMTSPSASLSPRSQASSRERSSLSFNFESLAISSDSIDLSQFQRPLH